MAAGVVRKFMRWLLAPPDNDRITFLDRSITVFSKLTMLLIVVVVVITFFEVVMRYVFGQPTLWVNELTLWLGSVIFLAAGAYTMQRRAHIRITAVYDLLPHSLKLVCEFIALFVLLAYAGMMIYAGFDTALDTLLRWERFGTYWNPPIPAVVKPLVLIITFLVAIQAVNNLLVDWLGFGRKNEEMHPSDEHKGT